MNGVKSNLRDLQFLFHCKERILDRKAISREIREQRKNHVAKALIGGEDLLCNGGA